jgi:propanol-preferring alcohol dehydrogenase
LRAAILGEGRLILADVPRPSAGYEEVLVRITAAGVCHSDVHLVKGDWPTFKLPLHSPMGHEGIGVVEDLGPGADKYVKRGDRVILGLGGSGGGYWCGACKYCLGGKPWLCKNSRGLFGTYAEYISVWVKTLVNLPDEVGDMEVPLACGGLTAYGAVKKLIRFGVLPGEPVAMIGAAGGLGHYGVQIAKAFGYKVIGIDVGPDKMDFLKALGADYALDVREAEPFVKQKFGGVQASVVFSPKIAGFEQGLRLLTRGGLFVSVGIPASSEGPFSITPLEMLRKDPLIMSSAVGTVEDMRELVRLAAEGRIKTRVSRVAPLSEINQVLEELEKGMYSGRAVINDMTG